MHQQGLQLVLPPRYDYGLWVRHPGVELAASKLALWLIQGGRLWLTSDDMAGKTHLLHVLADEHRHLSVLTIDDRQAPALRLVADWLDQLQDAAYWAIDIPAGPLPRATGTALFHLIERSREMNRPLAIAWRCPDSALEPPEMASRLRMFDRAILQTPVADQELLEILQSVAHSLQWEAPESLLKWMLRSLPRDLHSLVSALKHLDTASRGERGRITQAWAEQQLKGVLRQPQLTLP